jgi:hypothetical protein
MHFVVIPSLVIARSLPRLVSRCLGLLPHPLRQWAFRRVPDTRRRDRRGPLSLLQGGPRKPAESAFSQVSLHVSQPRAEEDFSRVSVHSELASTR